MTHKLPIVRKIFSKRKTVLALFIVIIIATPVLVIILNGNNTSEKTLRITPAKFDVYVEANGEIKAESSLEVFPPDEFYDQELSFYEMKIIEMVPEGTLVKPGDYVATLDVSEIDRKLKDLRTTINNQSQTLSMAIIDSSLTLSNERSSIQSLKDKLTEDSILLLNSAFESEASQRRAAIKTNQTLKQLQNKINYYQKRIGSEKRRIDYYSRSLADSKRLEAKMMAFSGKCRLVSPGTGIIVYHRRWNGEKLKAGNSIDRFNYPKSVAYLPDLSRLISEFNVSEIDVPKLKTGQTVTLTIDAIPDRTFDGTISYLSNTGQSNQVNDYNNYMVQVKVNAPDSTIKPAMTSKNRILIQQFTNVLSIPLSAMHSEAGHKYVFVKSGWGVEMHEIETSVQNNTDIIVTNGLKNNDLILLTKPINPEGLKRVMLN